MSTPRPFSALCLVSCLLAPVALVQVATAGEPIIFEPPISAPIEGCGEVVYDEICGSLFKMDDGGFYTFTGLDNYTIGDRFHLAGDVCLICLMSPCGSPYSAVFNASVSLCWGGKIPQTVPFDECVEVVPDPSCGPLLETASGTLFYAADFIDESLVGQHYRAIGEYSSNLLVFCAPGGPVPATYPFFTELTLVPCGGDLSHDGVVDGADLALLLAAWGPCAEEGSCAADFNGDHKVDGADLALLLADWS